jgi:hypothetical protein
MLCDLLLDIPKHRGWRDGLEKEGGFDRKETVDRGKGDVPREDVERVAVRDVRIRGSSIVTLTDAVAERVVSSKDKVTVAFALLVSENSNRLLAGWTLSSTTDSRSSTTTACSSQPSSTQPPSSSSRYRVHWPSSSPAPSPPLRRQPATPQSRLLLATPPLRLGLLRVQLEGEEAQAVRALLLSRSPLAIRYVLENEWLEREEGCPIGVAWRNMRSTIRRSRVSLLIRSSCFVCRVAIRRHPDEQRQPSPGDLECCLQHYSDPVCSVDRM